jgi:hypothetical protein
MCCRVNDHVTRVTYTCYAVGSKPGIHLDERFDSPATSWYFFILFHKNVALRATFL